ncbi:UTRA domain-containing protein [Vibrio sp. S11_S32]|uniref:UTRA domain-containing protein n=1 Tax=Vibrio sp. S11_S32 TaxID=2720225 RepID=UPI00167FF794|nr:UTRA domain-containing protein [Vibrio sp. S11_S32]MBD1577730.1 UTRA domain-containing protein [Vibrio sp. S11_S32]
MQYVKIKEAIVEQIDAGALLPMQKLPSERQLADSFNTTRVTLREALSLLETEGKIFREDRRGWFISPQRFQYDLSEPQPFELMAQEQHLQPLIQLISATSMLADKQASQLLALPAFSKVFKLKRLLSLDTRPVAFVLTYVSESKFAGLLECDLTGSLPDLFQQHYQQTYLRTVTKMTMTSLDADIAQALRTTSGSSALLIERQHINLAGQTMAHDLEYWRHDAVEITSSFSHPH